MYTYVRIYLCSNADMETFQRIGLEFEEGGHPVPYWDPRNILKQRFVKKEYSIAYISVQRCENFDYCAQLPVSVI